MTTLKQYNAKTCEWEPITEEQIDILIKNI